MCSGAPETMFYCSRLRARDAVLLYSATEAVGRHRYSCVEPLVIASQSAERLRTFLRFFDGGPAGVEPDGVALTLAVGGPSALRLDLPFCAGVSQRRVDCMVRSLPRTGFLCICASA
jgi:hypothetical protein